MTESEPSYSLVQVTATIEWTQLCISCLQLATKFISSSSSCIVRGLQTTAASKLYDFITSDTTVHTAGECSIKTENHGVSRDFQHFLDSAAIELDDI